MYMTAEKDNDLNLGPIQSLVKKGIEIQKSTDRSDFIGIINNWKKHKDNESREIIINSCIRLILKWAMNYRKSGVSVQDLVSEGILGVMKAVEVFDESRSPAFHYFAEQYIKSYITSYVIRNSRHFTMPTGSDQSRIIFRANSIKDDLSIDKRLSELNSSDCKRIAHALGVKSRNVEHYANTESLVSSTDKEGNIIDIIDVVPDSSNVEEEVLSKIERERKLNIIEKAITNKAKLYRLSKMQKKVFRLRYLQGYPIGLKEIGESLNISRQRASQLENKAFAKVKAYVHNVILNKPF